MTEVVSVSADGSKGVKPVFSRSSGEPNQRFSIRRWIEGCEAIASDGIKTQEECFSIRRWIEGCEAAAFFAAMTKISSFSIRRWIEGCEAIYCYNSRERVLKVSVSADGSKGVKRAVSVCVQIQVWVSVSADGSKGVKPNEKQVDY